MNAHCFSRRLASAALLSAALLALLGATTSAQATISVFTLPAAFAAATAAPGVDTFDGLSTSAITLSPTTRLAGVYAYTASAPGDLFGGDASNPFLSPDNALDTVTFSDFSGAVRGFAGNFFGSGLDGTFLTGGVVTLVATDALGATSTQTVAPNGVNTKSFLGFVSDAALVSMVLTAVQGTSPSPAVWPSVDNLTLAAASAVPEPGRAGLMLAGLGVLGACAWLARRRNSSAAGGQGSV